MITIVNREEDSTTNGDWWLVTVTPKQLLLLAIQKAEGWRKKAETEGCGLLALIKVITTTDYYRLFMRHDDVADDAQCCCYDETTKHDSYHDSMIVCMSEYYS